MSGSGGPRDVVGRYALLATLDMGTKAIGLAATVVIARHFGEELFGQITLAQSFVMYGILAATLGMDLYAVRNVARWPDTLGRIASTVMLLRGLLGFPAFALLVLLAAWIPPLAGIVGLVALFGLSLFTGAVSLTWVLQAKRRTLPFGLANLATQALYLAFIFAGIHFALGAWSVPAALVISEAVVAALVLGLVVRAIAPLARPLARRESLEFLGQASSIGVGRILRLVALGSDVVIIALFLPIQEVGVYAAANKLFMLGVSLVASYFVVLLPDLVERASESNDSLRSLVRSSLVWTIPVATVVLLSGLLFANWLVTWIYGPQFAEAAPVLQVLLVTLWIFLISAHFRTALIAQGRQRSNVGNVTISTAVHVGAKLILIPTLGLVGAALGTLLGESVLLLLGYRSVSSTPR